MDNHEGIIHKLPPEIIQKIAAGEVISRPSSAVKELIENSIDAGSTLIRIELSSNPLDYCEIADNGTGINYNDMLVVCNRYTTSKTINDIYGIKTLGFRGEALSSLSQSSHVTITSRTCNDTKRTTMKYNNCIPILDDVIEDDGPQGFIIRYENMFYNYKTRYNSLTIKSNNEFNLCLEIIQKYSIHFPDINFIFHKIGNITHEFTTCNNMKLYENLHDHDYNFYKHMSKYTDRSEIQEYINSVNKNSLLYLDKIKQSIKNIHGNSVIDTLYPVISNEFKTLFYNCKGFISHPNKSTRCNEFILFINNRLVDMTIFRFVTNSEI